MKHMFIIQSSINIFDNILKIEIFYDIIQPNNSCKGDLKMINEY